MATNNQVKVTKHTDGYGIITVKDGNGQYHSVDDEPAINKPNDSYKAWYVHGTLHRVNGPAYIKKDQTITEERWYQNGVVHRVGGPATTSEIFDGTYFTKKFHWKENERLHNDEGPAFVEQIFHSDKKTPLRVTSEWYQNGIRHCESGPAYIQTEHDGTGKEISRKELYFYLGHQYEKAQFDGIEKPKSKKGKKGIDMNKNEETATPPLLQTVKQEFSQALVRTTANKVVDIVKGHIVDSIADANGLKGKKRTAFVENLEMLFKSDYGDALISYGIGSALPLLGKMIPLNSEGDVRKAEEFLHSLAEEFRVRGMTVVTDQVAGMVMAVVPLITSSISGLVSSAMKTTDMSEMVRVSVEESSQKTSSPTVSEYEETVARGAESPANHQKLRSAS